MSEFEVPDEAKNMLKEINGDISVITIAGGYRQGKSFLLNRVLLKNKKAFEVSNSRNACTKGIWVWSKVLQGHYDGKSVNLLIMDTEGLNSTEADPSHDMKIFTLAILTCTNLIYNSLGNISED